MSKGRLDGFALVFGLALALGWAVPGVTADELELIQPGKLSVSTEGTYPPFSFKDAEGNLDGLEIRLWQEITERLGLEYDPVIIKWESTLVGLLAGQFDVMGTTMDVTEERQKQITYSDGWLESGGVLMVQQDSDITSLDQIEGRTIGALVASSWAEAATARGAGEVKAYKAETDAIQDLVNGNIDGVVTDAIAAAYAIKQSNLPLHMVDEYLSHVQKGWGFQNGKPNLVEAVNAALAEMQADGTYARLTTDLIGIDPAPAEPIPSNL
jgi:polar amino acid transport system substrate-binding protein